MTDLAVSMPESVLFKEALVGLATDSGLHPLVPYFTCFIEDELHQLMPSVVTCIVAKMLGNRGVDDHWELRDFTAKLAATICKRFGHDYSSLQTRLTKTLLKSFLDRKRTWAQHYGAVQGLAALGLHVIRLLVLSNLETYLGFLEEILQNQEREMTRIEAWRVYGALLRAAGRSVYDLLKLFPTLPSPPANSVLRSNLRVISTIQTFKRKANTEELEQQPSPKKMKTDGPVVSPSNNTTITLGETSGNGGELEPEYSSAHKQTGDDDDDNDDNDDDDDKAQERKNEGSNNSRSLRTHAYLKQVWKDDLKSGQLVISLFELFSEGIMSFIPVPEMCLFL
ncbi:hypothetical protein L1987_14773 [Smallanthus sonchifolius]|uniref:Uncharacterized protein n=1 Tax=Smallanthus sonchifolius TaxID=185202 RepID=A0ACB9J4S4_9ASTR|nr:hypothetical protein L1987_14773 [Smallanthus sonchifolius]